MLYFEYEARDEATGQKVKGEVQAESEKSASKLLVGQGLAPLEIHSKGEGNLFSVLDPIKNHIGTKDKVLFSRQLSTLINAGLPLSQSLRTVADQTSNKAMKAVIGQIIGDVEGGKSFADALAVHPDVFSTVFISLVAAGEISGTLDSALDRIAAQQEKDADLVATIRGALVYPAIVLLVIVAVIVFMLVTVLPQVQLLYDDLHQSLPFITAAMMTMSKFITNFWWLIILLLIGAAFFTKRYIATESGRKVWDTLKMRMPLFGKLFMKMYMARWSRTGATLMAAGVPMLEMLRIDAEAVNNVNIQESTMQAAEKVKGGTSLSGSIKDDPNFLPLVSQMISIGEQSGAIDAMMAKTADFYEKELDNEVKAISTTIEPILMVVLAAVAGLMVAAILMPVYGLVGTNIGV